MRNTLPVLLAGYLLIVPGGLLAQPSDAFKVVVNAANPETSITKGKLSALFLKRATRWDNGEQVQPIELDMKTFLRQSFSQSVHSKDVAWVESFWNKMIFSGRASPPPVVASEEEILAFVRANPDAIGYVALGTPEGEGVKALELAD